MAIEDLKARELGTNHETYSTLENTFGFSHGHYYQPPRYLSLSYQGQTREVFDITGTQIEQVRREYPLGFNQKLALTTLSPIVGEKEINNEGLFSPLLTSGMYSIDLYGVYADWIRWNMPKGEPGDIESIREAVKRSGLRPVGDTYLHLIMPTLSDQTQRMLQRLGNYVYEDYWGEKSGYSWPGEATISVNTLSNMYQEGIRGVIVRRSQLHMEELPDEDKHAPGYWIPTPAGRMMAVVVDDGISGAVSFDDNLRADTFTSWQALSDEYHGKRYGHRAATDGERFGEHWTKDRGAFKFFGYRDVHLRQLVDQGTLTREIDFSDMPETTLAQEVTSWSCAHGKARWEGTCDCGELDKKPNHVRTFIQQEKQDLRGKIDLALTLTDTILDNAYPQEDQTGLKEWRNKFIAWFDTQREALATNRPLSTDQSNLSDTEKKWFLVEAALLIGSTSCGWFFGDIDSYERQLPRNTLYQVSDLVLNTFGQEEDATREALRQQFAQIIPFDRNQRKQQLGLS